MLEFSLACFVCAGLQFLMGKDWLCGIFIGMAYASLALHLTYGGGA